MLSRSRYILLLTPAFISATTAAICEPREVLFQSNAYVDYFSDTNQFQGGSVIASQEEWDGFLETFRPNVEGESLARTDIDFNEEKVVIGTYGSSATCLVEIDDVRLDCEPVGESTAMKLEIDVFDASLGCNIKCMALGQVIYAAVVPVEWRVDTNNIVVQARGPCAEATETSSTEEVYQKLELIQYSLGLDECASGECLSPNGTCAGIVSCFADPCMPEFAACEDDEMCTANYCGGCHAVCTPNNATSTVSPTAIDGIILDTTTSATDSGVQVEITTVTAPTDSNNLSPVPEPTPVPTDEELCNQIRVVFKSSALSRYIVPDGISGDSLTTIASQEQMSELLEGFMPMAPDASTIELESIDFSTEQVVFSTYYESSSCNVEIVTANYVCESTTVKIGLAVLDESAGCEVACDAEGQVVYAIATPIGADASLGTIINGPCLDEITLDTVTVATESTTESTEMPSTTVASTTPATSVVDSDSDNDPNQTIKPESGNVNVPEGLPRERNSSFSMGSSFVLLSATILLFYLF